MSSLLRCLSGSQPTCWRYSPSELQLLRLFQMALQNPQSLLQKKNKIKTEKKQKEINWRRRKKLKQLKRIKNEWLFVQFALKSSFWNGPLATFLPWWFRSSCCIFWHWCTRLKHMSNFNACSNINVWNFYMFHVCSNEKSMSSSQNVKKSWG